MSRLLVFSVCFLILVIGAGCKHEENRNADDEVKLENNFWKLLRYGLMEEELKEFPENQLSTLYFNAETKMVKGDVLCNSFESTYTTIDGSISIASVAPTELFCGEDKEGVASFIVASLSSIDRYEVDSSRLIIYSVKSRVLQYGKE